MLWSSFLAFVYQNVRTTFVSYKDCYLLKLDRRHCILPAVHFGGPFLIFPDSLLVFLGLKAICFMGFRRVKNVFFFSINLEKSLLLSFELRLFFFFCKVSFRPSKLKIEMADQLQQRSGLFSRHGQDTKLEALCVLGVAALSAPFQSQATHVMFGLGCEALGFSRTRCLYKTTAVGVSYILHDRNTHLRAK